MQPCRADVDNAPSLIHAGTRCLPQGITEVQVLTEHSLRSPLSVITKTLKNNLGIIRECFCPFHWGGDVPCV